jgi:site-specific recombinase XerD
VLPGNYFALAESFKRSLRARGASPKTLLTYGEAMQQFGEFLASSERSLQVRQITGDDIRDFEAALFTRGFKSSTVNNRHRGLQSFFKWMLAEDELDVNPMAKVKAPELKEVRPLVIVTPEQWAKLLRGAEGKDFVSRRDMAILRLFLDTPVRLSELAGMEISDVDFDQGCVKVLGKGGKYRNCPIGSKTEAVLDRYLRSRAEHRHAGAPWLWLGPRGRMTHSGIYQMVKDRAKAAGFPELHPHAFRATFAASWLRDGGTEQGLQRIAGWSSKAMIQRYTTLAADELAHEEYKRRRAPGDRL